MLRQRARPRAATSATLEGSTARDGVVARSAAQGWWATPALKAPRLLMVRGMPLKEMHLRPTSRISSAVASGERLVCAGARSWRTRREAGELRVNVAAACEGPGRLVRWFWVREGG